MKYTLLQGDCLERMKEMPDNSVDSIVTDPPYGLSFMGKKWDYDVPSVEIWAECLRVLKPGGHLLAFAGTRTQHRMAVRIEDAGFEIRDMIAWVYGSGFPKSLDVSKAIDNAAGAEREVVGFKDGVRGADGTGHESAMPGKATGVKQVRCDVPITAPATDAARQWAGWGTALKPALEPVTMARKPFPGTVAANVLEHGTGAINVDGCRVGIDPVADASQLRTMNRSQKDDANGWGMNQNGGDTPTVVSPSGRWPANLIHNGSDEVVGLFPVTGASKATPRNNQVKDEFFTGKKPTVTYGHNDNGGSAARFFYCAKASKKDRDEGCEGLPLGDAPGSKRSTPAEGRSAALGSPRSNFHPTVKPCELMKYLCRLVTPPGGTVLDPFMGSGSTGKGAVLEGLRFIGIEREAEYVEIARARIARKEVLIEREERCREIEEKRMGQEVFDL